MQSFPFSWYLNDSLIAMFIAKLVYVTKHIYFLQINIYFEYTIIFKTLQYQEWVTNMILLIEKSE